MASHGAPALTPTAGPGTSVAIVAASWHTAVMDGLIAGAQRALAQAGVEKVRLVRVPGSFELPVVVQHELSTQDAAVALGVVIRGGTPHFDYVCQVAAQGLSEAALKHGKPVGFGLLTCDNDEQALDRAGLPGSREDKGHEAATAALLTLEALRS